jgi:hypothetical protein
MTTEDTTPAVAPVASKAKKAAKAKPVAKKAAKAKKAAAPRKLNGEQSRSVIPLEVAKAYPRTKDKAGKTHVDNGDSVANRLRGLDLESVYAMAAKLADVPVKELKAKYGALNPGMQRMNLGNKIRALAE